MKVILPIVDQCTISIINKFIPDKIFPDIIRDLIILVLENQESDDVFIEACMGYIEHTLEYCNDPEVADLPLISDTLIVILISFYNGYKQILRELLIDTNISFNGLSNRRVVNGICIEATFDAPTKQHSQNVYYRRI